MAVGRAPNVDVTHSRRAQRRRSKHIHINTDADRRRGKRDSAVSGEVAKAKEDGVCDPFPDVKSTAAVATAGTYPPPRRISEQDRRRVYRCRVISGHRTIGNYCQQ